MLSVLEMFNIGIGSSSSHTVGPMKAALDFAQKLDEKLGLDQIVRIETLLFGSLALTGEGHGTIYAVINGLSGENPKDITSERFFQYYNSVIANKELYILNKKAIPFNLQEDILLKKDIFLKDHPNAMRFIAIDSNGNEIYSSEYYSVGGGFIVEKNRAHDKKSRVYPFSFTQAHELYNLCQENSTTIAGLAKLNELSYQSEESLNTQVFDIIQVMRDSINHGINSTEIDLPGGLNLRRRASKLYNKLNTTNIANNVADQRTMAMAFAMAVNEENAAFGKIVTAPTNGSAGTIAGVLEYYIRFGTDVTNEKLINFMLTAGAIGVLYKLGASISAAEVGCQGEIGVSCSMAAAALTEVMGGNIKQVMRAAEIAMEHSLGMTCDPVKGLVQVPCIERNGVAASRAIDIANMVLLEDGEGIISLDQVIQTMLTTGHDMTSHYKETSLGGLAVNHINC